MKKPWYDTLLFALTTILALTLIVFIMVTGITTLVTFLSIVFVGAGGLYVGLIIGRREVRSEA